jgi:hypothetical protein
MVAKYLKDREKNLSLKIMKSIVVNCLSLKKDVNLVCITI